MSIASTSFPAVSNHSYSPSWKYSCTRRNEHDCRIRADRQSRAPMIAARFDYITTTPYLHGARKSARTMIRNEEENCNVCFCFWYWLFILLQRPADSINLQEDDENENDMSRSCVLQKYVGHILRQNLRNMVEGICPQRKFARKLYASQFQVSISLLFSSVYARYISENLLTKCSGVN